MRSSMSLVGILTAALMSAQCSGGGDGGDSGGTPTSPGPSTPSAVSVSIVATQGNKSFVPNPVPTAVGEQVVFRNNDTVPHRIVMDDGSVDFGTLAPGASSQARGVGAGGTFHCTLHLSMVGSINGAVAPEPPPGSGDGY